MELERLGISKREITAYNKKHIFTEEDLVRWFPRKYRDYTQFTDILDAKDGDFIAVRAKLMRIDRKGSPANPFVSLGLISAYSPTTHAITSQTSFIRRFLIKRLLYMGS